MLARFILNWYPWIVLLLLLILVWMVSSLRAQVNELYALFAARNRMSREDLEKAYVAGQIGRDDYERLKDRAR